MTAAESVFEAVGAITFGLGARHSRNLTLSTGAQNDPEADYAVLDEALALRRDGIEGNERGGRVPELKVAQPRRDGVLLLDGEELVGAKQNRVLNLRSSCRRAREHHPVSCVEPGRWSRSSARFASSPRAHYAEGRQREDAAGHARLRRAGARRRISARSGPIAEKMARLGSRSGDGGDVGDVRRTAAAARRLRLRLPGSERPGGALFLVNGRPGGFELFDAAATWTKLSPKLVRSYALDAIDCSRESSVSVEPCRPGPCSTPSGRATHRSSMQSARAATFA